LQTPLHVASYKGHTGVVQVLLAHGAAPEALTKARARFQNAHPPAPRSPTNPRSQRRCTTLHLAAMTDVGLVVALLLSTGRVSTEDRDCCSSTPLHAAASHGAVAAATALLDAGADIEAVDERGQTAMHVAASLGHGGVVALLLRRGADPAARDRAGRTAQQLTDERAEAEALTARLGMDKGIPAVNTGRLRRFAAASPPATPRSRPV